MEELLEALEADSELAADEAELEPELEPEFEAEFEAELNVVLDVTPEETVEADEALPMLLTLLEEEALFLLEEVVGVSPISP